MRDRIGFIYWLAAGASIGFGLIGFMTIGFPFLIVGIILCIVGVWKPGIGGSWAFPIGLGGLPALAFLSHIVEGLRTALNPYCDWRGPGTTLSPPAGPVECTFVPDSYYVMFVISVAVTLSGVALYLMLRGRSGDGAPA